MDIQWDLTTASREALVATIGELQATITEQQATITNCSDGSFGGRTGLGLGVSFEPTGIARDAG